MITTSRMLINRINMDYAHGLLHFYIRNQRFLEPYEPSKSTSFYTLSYQENALKAEMIKEDMGKSIKFFLHTKAEPEILMGLITLNEIVKGCFLSCYVGYKLDHEYSNQGYMTEALEGVINYAFLTLKLHRIEANIMPTNYPSLKVVEKLGFINEGLSKEYLKINGKWEDHIHMVKLNHLIRV